MIIGLVTKLLIPTSQFHRDRITNVLPHVTWCPTGPLAFLPLHAAGIYGSGGEQKSKVFDHVVSSYTPTLSALLRPPSSVQAPQWDDARILIVSQSNTPNLSRLPGAAEEAAKIRPHFLRDHVIHLEDAQATVESVLGAMDLHHCQFVHLACHGLQDLDDPTKSAFALHDGHLHLSQLMTSKSTDTAELAFLSACQTATGDTKVPEEAVHLTAGMLFVGYKAVIGTVWSIGDQDAPLVADEVYRHLKEGLKQKEGEERRILNVAYALHEAVKRLREEVGEMSFLRWAPFVHFGM
jgi:CHAT domain-containing protein